ncbi:MAG: hypothetical protein LBU04_00070 [Christensenellaceae bacterium]|jgi:NRPS condensation-like uncharacterized protein|nr:hypothetical protein [Christensenellaceae bacterium]
MYYKAEMWDKMQDIMSRYNDHMTHGYLQFDSHLDKDILKKALSISVDKFPLFKTKYYSGLFRATWKSLRHYNFEDCYQFVETEGVLLEVCEKFLVTVIDETKGPQVKFLHARCAEKDALAILINHQCMDGADLRIYYKSIAEIYNDLLNNGNGDIYVKNGSRSEMQIYDQFTPKQLEEIEGLISYSKKQKHKIAFPFEKSRKSARIAKINKLVINASEFAKLRTNGKKLGVSVNDIVLGAFYRVATLMIKLPQGATLGLPNMINMRRYIKGGESAGFCNLTSMSVVNLNGVIGDDIFETIARCKNSMDALKSDYMGLHGWSLLRTVQKLIPHGIAKILIGTFFKNPLIGLSNIGIIDHESLVFGNARLEAPTYMTGSIKYPPYMQLALTTLYNEVTFTIAIKATEKDHKMFEEFFLHFGEELRKFALAEITDEYATQILNKANGQ